VSIFGRDKQDLGALPTDVAELLARGSGHVELLDPEVRARLRARLLSPAPAAGATSGDKAQGPGPAPSAAAGAGRVFLSKPVAVVLTTFALGMGSGAALHGWLRSPGTPAMVPLPQASPPAPASPPAVLSPAPPSGVQPPQPAAQPSRSPARPAPAPRADRDRDDDDDGLGRERALLEQARAALVGGDPGRALAALDRHRRIFPDGRLAEERDVLRVRTLAAAGRTRDAQAEAERFLRKHPASLFRPAVEQAIAKTDSRSAPNEVTGGHE
jgi:hypothetical protein